MKKILLVFGTRPEAIKMAPIVLELRKHSDSFKQVICVTSQHRQMLDQVLSIFDIKPDYDLDIMKNNQDLFDISVNVLKGLKDVFLKEKPDIVLVQGDTTTAFIAGLAAFYLKITIGHIEAGLRTYNKYSPFPEEKNRHMLTAIADLHFSPTEWSKQTLIKENVPENKIFVTGNTVIDALKDIVLRQKESNAKKYWLNYFKEKWDMDLSDKKYRWMLVTGHRRENFGQGMENVCSAIKEISGRNPNLKIVYPVHLNPNVRKTVDEFLRGMDRIHLIEPLEYEPFSFLMEQSYMVLTDSGGVQEEAPSLGKPVLVTRDTTERPEGVEAGVVKLVGTDKKAIVDNAQELLNNQELYNKMSRTQNPYGDGCSANRIVEILKKNL